MKRKMPINCIIYLNTAYIEHLHNVNNNKNKNMNIKIEEKNCSKRKWEREEKKARNSKSNSSTWLNGAMYLLNTIYVCVYSIFFPPLILFSIRFTLYTLPKKYKMGSYSISEFVCVHVAVFFFLLLSFHSNY